MQKIKLKPGRLNFVKTIISAFILVAIAGITTALINVKTSAPANVKNIMLIHGAWADGSGWEGVYSILKKDGFNVTIVSNPNTSLAADVAITKAVMNMQDGPVILVGHSLWRGNL